MDESIELDLYLINIESIATVEMDVYESQILNHFLK